MGLTVTASVGTLMASVAPVRSKIVPRRAGISTTISWRALASRTYSWWRNTSMETSL